MRIAVATRFAQAVGGVETYLGATLPGLVSRGHDVRVWHEFGLTEGGELMVPSDISMRPLGTNTEGALASISAWPPDVVFLNGLSEPAIEERLGRIAPMLVLLHAYHGTCISGSKAFSFPTPQVCTRALGPGCLVNYLPRHCGGWSPVTMVSSYVRQRRRQALLTTCEGVATLSEYMRQECIAQGVAPQRVRCLPPFAVPRAGGTVPAPIRPRELPVRLLFMGRMERLKGGHVLLEALDRLDSTHRRQLAVTFAGDGRERARWEAQASRVSRGECPIRFTGWVDGPERQALLESTDLLVVPSLWPEPWGLVGTEAAAAAVPALAFDVGGIREWLTDAETGRLADLTADPAGSLARALEDCLADPERLSRWGRQAYAASQARSSSGHLDALEQALADVAGAHAHAYTTAAGHETSPARA